MKTAWYLRLSEDDVSECAIVVGDRSRVRIIQDLMTDAKELNEDRGLLTVTGYFNGVRIVVVAFGMGAPIAAVVCHELIDLGVTRILRLGTMMTLGSTTLGDYVLADTALSRDGTAESYVSSREVFSANSELNADIAKTLHEHGIEPLRGRVVSCDGFYTQMMSLDKEDSFAVLRKQSSFETDGCIGMDMETAALFAMGEHFDVEVSSLCLATVAGRSREKMENKDRTLAEEELALIGLQSLTKRGTK